MGKRLGSWRLGVGSSRRIERIRVHRYDRVAGVEIDGDDVEATWTVMEAMAREVVDRHLRHTPLLPAGNRGRAAAEFFAAKFDRPCRFAGAEGPAALLSDASRCHALMGPPPVSSDRLLELVAAWVLAGGESLNKATHFEVADGRF